MDRIRAAEVFVAIVDRGSMTAAARALDMSRSMVTRYLAEMEDWAGARLLHRSTRRLGLTPSGEQALSHCRRLLDLARDVAIASRSGDVAPRGRLRISCSSFLAENVLVPFLPLYLKRYPAVSVDLHSSNDMVNLVAERIDLALRITNDLDPNLIVRSLGHCPSVLCATPAYLQRRGEPLGIEDLGRHDCLAYTRFRKSLWHFEQGDETLSVPVSGPFGANDAMVLLQATLAGLGISMLPRQAVASHLDAGSLVELLPGYRPQTLGIHGIYSSRRHISQTLRTMIDMLVEHWPADLR